jgi:hypothetical protein
MWGTWFLLVVVVWLASPDTIPRLPKGVIFGVSLFGTAVSVEIEIWPGKSQGGNRSTTETWTRITQKQNYRLLKIHQFNNISLALL